MADTDTAEDRINWETNETIDTIDNDEGSRRACTGKNAASIKQYVRDGNLSPYFYDGFAQQRPPSTLDDVDWEAVAAYMSRDEDDWTHFMNDTQDDEEE